jgi:hypothetical protein
MYDEPAHLKLEVDESVLGMEVEESALDPE